MSQTADHTHFDNAALMAELAKPQFMTTTSGAGAHTLEFSFHGENARQRRDDLHDALAAAARSARAVVRATGAS